jgi:bidirectional [NiFe] hydrogenase diaphorase subunit
LAEVGLTTPGDDERWDIVAERILRHGNAPDALIEVLHAVQEVFGYLDPAALRYVGHALGVPLSKVYGVATFYSFFTLSPAGARTCVVCTGTACYIDGSTAILDEVARSLGVRPGETTDDGRVSVRAVRCYGTCSLAPLVVLDGEVRGRVSVEDVLRSLEAP